MSFRHLTFGPQSRPGTGIFIIRARSRAGAGLVTEPEAGTHRHSGQQLK